MSRPLKLLYACADDSADPHLWSGTVWNCRQALAAAGCEITAFDRIPFECPLHLRLLHKFYKLRGKKIHFLQIEPSILQKAADRIASRFAQGDCDAVFSPGTGVPVYALLPPHIPVFTYLDATKKTWIETYFGLETLCGRSRRHVEQIDRVSLTNNRLTFISSEWAAEEASRDYGIPLDRFAVVPFGANIADTPTRTEVESWVSTRSREHCHLFFLGKEWERKGGPEALLLTRQLNALGIATTLDIVGCTPPPLSEDDARITRLHGFIDHSKPEGRKKFRDLLIRSHAIVFLSRAEAFGIALCEAAAFGVPAIAAPNGGIPTIVKDGLNGWFSPVPFDPVKCTTAFATAWRSPATLHKFALSARDQFEQRLNWSAAGQTLRDYMDHALRQTSHLHTQPLG
jgi:glycosyltransferase involved in cell wall biosynthesis